VHARLNAWLQHCHGFTTCAHSPLRCWRTTETRGAVATAIEKAATAALAAAAASVTQALQTATSSARHGAARAASALLAAATALPRPPALHLHVGAPLPFAALARTAPRVRRLSVAHCRAAVALRALLHEGVQLRVLAALSWVTALKGDVFWEHAGGLHAFEDSLFTLVEAQPGLRSLRASKPLPPAGMTALFPRLAPLTALTQLDLENCTLACDGSQLDADVGGLALAVHQMSALQIVHLPQVHGALHPLAPLATELASLPALSKLTLHWDPFEPAACARDWPVLGSMSALQSLKVDLHTRLHHEEALPQTLLQLTALTSMTLQRVLFRDLACARALTSAQQLRQPKLCDCCFSNGAVSVLTAGATQLGALCRLTVVAEAGLN
jgi:hypothetical protein